MLQKLPNSANDSRSEICPLLFFGSLSRLWGQCCLRRAGVFRHSVIGFPASLEIENVTRFSCSA
jgi:hypothetical protein